MKKRLLATIPVLLVVFLCNSFPVFAYQNNGSDQFYSQNIIMYQDPNDSNKFVRATIWLTSLDYDEDSYPGIGSTVNGDFTYVVKGRLVLDNKFDQDVQFPNTLIRLFVYPENNYPANGSFKLVNYEFNYGSIYPAYVTTGNQAKIGFCQTSNSNHSTYISIPGNQSVECYFTLYYSYNSYAGITAVNAPRFTNSTVYFDIPSIPTDFSFGTFSSDNYGFIRLLYYKFLEFLDSYNSNVPQSTNVTNESSALENTSDNVHNQESSYYTQTNTALGNTGLSNFSFSPNVIGGLGKAKDQFTYVWNKLGDYKDVYLFSMTLAIALMIIRHVRPIRRKKEE